MIKTIIISDFQAAPMLGGGQIATHDLVKCLSKYYKIKYIGYPFKGVEKNPNVEIIYPLRDFSKKLPNLWGLQLKSRILRRLFWNFPDLLIKSLNISEDLLISNNELDFILMNPKMKIEFNKVIIRKQSSLKNFSAPGYPERLIKNRNFRIIAINKTDYKTLSKLYGKAKTKLIPCGIKLNLFNKNEIKGTILRLKKQLNIENKKIIFSIGRLEDDQKGFSFGINAMRLLKTNNYIYLIAGEGSSKKRYQHLIRKYNLKNKVKLIGSCSEIEKSALFSMASVVLQPSLHESFGLVMIEALREGAILLVTKNAGALDVIKDQKNGFFINTCPDDIASKLDLVLNMRKNKLNKLSHAAKITAKNYSIERMQDSFHRLIESMFK